MRRCRASGGARQLRLGNLGCGFDVSHATKHTAPAPVAPSDPYNLACTRTSQVNPRTKADRAERRNPFRNVRRHPWTFGDRASTVRTL
jgi:hypothetical protein